MFLLFLWTVNADLVKQPVPSVAQTAGPPFRLLSVQTVGSPEARPVSVVWWPSAQSSAFTWRELDPPSSDRRNSEPCVFSVATVSYWVSSSGSQRLDM